MPALLVMLVVMLLLRGFTGTYEAIKIQAAAIATCLFGHGDGNDVAGVIAHTLPLAISATLVTLVLARRWLTLDSWMSIVILSGIILVGSSIGGLLKCVLPEPKATEVASSAYSTTEPIFEIEEPNSKENRLTIGIPTLGSRVTNSSGALSTTIVLDNPIYRPAEGPLLPLQKTSAWQQLGEIDWFAVPDLQNARQREIEPLKVVPKFSGIAALVSGTINQVLGFLVAYQPRLFLAAIIAGSWLRWTWHRKLLQFQEKLDEEAASDFDETTSSVNSGVDLPAAA